MRRKYLGIMVLVMLLGSNLYGLERVVVYNDLPIIFNRGEVKWRDNTTYVPLREMSDYLGIGVEWNGSVKLSKGDQLPIELDQNQLMLEKGVYYTPIKYLANDFGYKISSDGEGLVIRISDQRAKLSDTEVFERYKPKVTHKQVVYLTFDDGPNIHTPEILDLLKEHDMKATFFMLEGQMKRYPEVVKRMLDEGHSVALHGVTHNRKKFYGAAKAPVTEMNTANGTLKKITGKTTNLVRVPYGSVPYLTDDQYRELVKQDYRIWDWNVDSRDWSLRNGEKAYKSVIRQLEKSPADEEVILFHDSKETVESLRRFLEWCDVNAYESKGLTEKMTPKTFKK